MPDMANIFFILRLGLVNSTIGVIKTVRSKAMFRAV